MFIIIIMIIVFLILYNRGGRNRIGRRLKRPKKSWEEGEIGLVGKSSEEGEKEKLGVGRIELERPG